MKPSEAYHEEDQESSGSTPLGVQILAFLCGLVVVYLGFKSVRQDFIHVQKLTQLNRFIETPGKLLHIKVRIDSAGPADEYYPDVLYEYFVEGKSIWGWRLSYEDEPNTKAFWEERLSGYALQVPVNVFYDPDLPKDAILEKKHDGLYRTWMKMALGIGFMMAGFVLVILPLAGWVRKPKA